MHVPLCLRRSLALSKEHPPFFMLKLSIPPNSENRHRKSEQPKTLKKIGMFSSNDSPEDPWKRFLLRKLFSCHCSTFLPTFSILHKTLTFTNVCLFLFTVSLYMLRPAAVTTTHPMSHSCITTGRPTAQDLLATDSNLRLRNALFLTCHTYM